MNSGEDLVKPLSRLRVDDQLVLIEVEVDLLVVLPDLGCQLEQFVEVGDGLPPDFELQLHFSPR